MNLCKRSVSYYKLSEAKACKVWMLLATEAANSFYMSVCKVQKGQALLGSLSQNLRGGVWDRGRKKKQWLGGNILCGWWGNWVTPTAYKAQTIRHPSPFFSERLPFLWVVNFSFLLFSSSWLPYQKEKERKKWRGVGGGTQGPWVLENTDGWVTSNTFFFKCQQMT